MRALAKPFCAVLLSLLAGISVARGDVFGAKETILDNGLRVIVVENHRAPVVTHMIWYRVGAMDEPPGKSGIAHFLEHLMFKGTDTLGPGEFSATVARHGGEDNAFTSQDYTAYYQSVASDRLDLVMELEADRMANLDIAAEHFEPEKQVVLEERRQRTDSDPGAILAEQAAPSFYRSHPYAIPVIGWPQEIAALTLQDAVAFYETFYTPNNATLVVSGDVDAETVFDLAEKHYGGIPSRHLPERPEYRLTPLLVSTEITYSDNRVRQPGITIRKPAPSWATSSDRSETYALDVLSQILGGGSTSKLYRALVIDSKIAAGAGAWYDGDGRGPGTMGFYISPSDGVSLEEAEQALRAEIAGILEDGIDPSDVERAITRLQDAAATARDSLSGPAMAIGRALSVGLSLEDVERWPERIGAVTVDQVNAAAKKVLNAPGEVVTRLVPEQKDEGASQ